MCQALSIFVLRDDAHAGLIELIHLPAYRSPHGEGQCDPLTVLTIVK